MDSEVYGEGLGGRPGRPTPVLNPATPFHRGSVQMLPSPTEARLPGFLQKNPWGHGVSGWPAHTHTHSAETWTYTHPTHMGTPILYSGRKVPNWLFFFLETSHYSNWKNWNQPKLRDLAECHQVHDEATGQFSCLVNLMIPFFEIKAHTFWNRLVVWAVVLSSSQENLTLG